MSRFDLIGLLFCAALLSQNACGQTSTTTVTDATSAVDSDVRPLHEFFEAKIRPLLLQHCVGCHGTDEQNAGLRLDSRAAMIAGGDSGPVLNLQQPRQSRLLQAVQRKDDLAMPPTGPLTPAEIAALQRWVQTGAIWPDTSESLSIDAAADQHWAFQAPKSVVIPAAYDGHPIDYFIDRRLQQKQLDGLPSAAPATLVRRLSFTLTGLPPTAADLAPARGEGWTEESYRRLIDRLLDSAHYGEHWARHWLDVARYSDTKGYVYAREERFWVHAWRYRDWVVSSFNRDLPYDRFLLLQLAADQVPDAQPTDLAAMGFLTLGRRFLGVERDIIDDRIDVVTRGTMALTVSCARCHDHKYDPIPTADYYSLYGVFDSSMEQLQRIDVKRRDEQYETELNKRRDKLQAQLAEFRKRSSNRARSRLRGYLTAQTELHKYPPKGFDQIFEESDLLPAFVRRWEACLRAAEINNDPIFVPWHRFRQVEEDQFAAEAADIAANVCRNKQIPCRVREIFETAPRTFADVIDGYATLFEQVVDEQTTSAAEPNDPEQAALVKLLFGPQSPTVVPDEPIVHIESFFTSARCTELWKLQGEVDRWIIQASQPPAFAVSLRDRAVPTEPRIFRRGNPMTPGAGVPRQFLQVVAGPDRKPFRRGSGRLELAEKIASRDNPLTARVIVNRVWAHHFGRGLVDTPSDFGLRSMPSSHPELLDWLTHWFIENDWQLKPLHRLIVTSRAFRRSSTFDETTKANRQALAVDPDNRLLWRFTARRLTFEQLRDAMLLASGQLDRTVGGKPQKLFDNPNNVRRTLYGLVDRQFLPATLRVFDFANPDLHVPSRPQTTIPQQALFLMNHPFVLRQASLVAEQAQAQESADAVVEHCFQATLRRSPTDTEQQDALQLLTASPSTEPQTPSTAADWSYGFGAYDEAGQKIVNFQKLPFHSGSAWQGGPQWPDRKLGWVQLTAEGGHPGNSRQVACIRRWTAPQDLTITIESKLTHQPTAGDGIRAFVVADDDGELLRQQLHASSAELNVSGQTVRQGQSLSFVVDIDEVLNSDQFLWPIRISGTSADGSQHTWDSVRDFSGPSQLRPLSPAAQLAQVLLLSNEFMFVD